MMTVDRKLVPLTTAWSISANRCPSDEARNLAAFDLPFAGLVLGLLPVARALPAGRVSVLLDIAMCTVGSDVKLQSNRLHRHPA
jgi:hypothetical protein